MMKDVIIKELKKDSKRIYEDDFFEMIKEDSLIDFRNNINFVQSINPTYFLENKVISYYEELLKNFNSKTSLFYIYDDFLELIEFGIKDFFKEYEQKSKQYNYIIDKNVITGIKDLLKKTSDFNVIYDFLADVTNRKISEIVIDVLFKDTIYNVWINIKEMLRFNKSLSENEQILNSEQIVFYQNFLNIDKVSCKEKIELYNKLKNKNIALMFYNDLRKLKDLSYKKIKQSMIKLKEHPDLKNNNLSSKFGVNIYDLRDKNYVMLVSCTNEYFDETDNLLGYYTLLSNENTSFYNTYKYLYGYCSFPEDYVMHVFEEDAGSGRISANESLSIGSRKVNRLMTSEEIIMNGEGYSEINLKNMKIDGKKDRFINLLRPDFIVAIDKIEEIHIKESKRLNIPIVIIKKKILKTGTSTIDYKDYLDDYTIIDFEGIENFRKKNR